MAKSSRYSTFTQEVSGHEKWIVGAFALAMFIHIAAAVSFGWIRVPALALPTDRELKQATFVMHDPVHIRSDAMRSPTFNPIDLEHAGNGPSKTAPVDLDPHILDNIRMEPLPALISPPIPDPAKVIAAAPISKGLPLVESPQADVAAEIAHMQVGPLAAPVSPALLADQMIASNIGKVKAGLPGGSAAGGNGTGEVPGFTDVESKFNPPAMTNAAIVEPAVIRLPADVLFNFNEAVLLPDATPLLEQAAGFITKYPQANVNVDGYTDSIGDASYNLKLSQQRAQAVQDWLSQHVPPGNYRFHSTGHGATDYVVDPNGNKDQQQQNRRVELLVQALKQQ